MENEFFYVNVDNDTDVESWSNKGGVVVNVASRHDDAHSATLTPEKARALAAALLRLADEAEGK